LIAVRLIGGLGNQLFQYAVGRTLALQLGVDLAVDRSAYRWRDGRRHALDPFGLPVVPLRSASLPLTRLSRVQRGLNTGGATPSRVVAEQSFKFDPDILNLSDGVYLEGFFQSENYFRQIADRVRADLAIGDPPGVRNRPAQGMIQKTLAVSLHVRRGDYVTHERTNKMFGTCSVDYYSRAADHIAHTTGAVPTFFVFSDDIDWAIGNLRLPYATHFITDSDTRQPHEDLWLMSLCHHHIIANSSFSWWGAWLNPSLAKIVVAPAVWFGGGGVDESTLIPASWSRL
jgi:hypothetical protein